MTEPDYEGPAIQVETSPLNFGADYGPDYTNTQNPDDEAKKEKAKPKGKKPFGGLGANKQARSGVRQLTNKDKDAIASLYAYLAMGLMPFRPTTASKVAECADQCAEAWYDLARENDAVRRAILAIIEGGAWGKIVAAHLPIMLTLIPDNHPLSMIARMNDIPDDINGLSDEQ